MYSIAPYLLNNDNKNAHKQAGYNPFIFLTSDLAPGDRGDRAKQPALVLATDARSEESEMGPWTGVLGLFVFVLVFVLVFVSSPASSVFHVVSLLDIRAASSALDGELETASALCGLWSSRPR